MAPKDPRLGRLRWRGRRGMKELDRLFENFFATDLKGCDDATIAVLERLLDCQDTDLLDWLLGRSEPPDSQLKRMVERVRDA